MKFTSRWLFPVAALAVAACADSTTEVKSSEAMERSALNVTSTTTCATGCVYVSTTGNDANGGASAGEAKLTIGAAIMAAPVGGTVVVAAGEYVENITIAKQLTMEGAGSALTTVKSKTANTPVITITGSGADAANRLVIRNLTVTGATGGADTPAPNTGAGILVVGSTTAKYLTFSGVSATGNQGAGLAFNNTVGVEDVVVANATLSSNGQGIRIATAVPSFVGLTVSGTSIANNASHGFNYNESGRATNIGTNFSFTNTTFSNNSQAGVSNAHDVSFFGFKGTASLTDVTVISGNGPNTTHRAHGIVFSSNAFSGYSSSSYAPNISLVRVTASGTVAKSALTIQGYTDITGISMTDVDVTATTSPWGQITVYHVDDADLNLGNTMLKTLNIWTTGGADARNASFFDAISGDLLAPCAVESQVGHKPDVALADQYKYGLVLLNCAPVGAPVQAPAGADAEVAFADATGAPVAALTFDNIATAGVVTIAPITVFGGDNPAPAGFALGDSPVYYDIDFGGTFAGSINVCLVYPVGAFAGTEPALFHFEGGAWKNVTMSVNPTTRTVCGKVSSFSPFALGIDLSTVGFKVNGGTPVQVNTAVAINGTVPTGYTLQSRVGSAAFVDAAMPATLSFTMTGVYQVCLRFKDATSDYPESCVEVPVYDPTAGFVTGGGWFNSPATAYKTSPTLTGKAHFAFVSKYEKGKNVPTGNTSFKFDMAGLSFASTSYEWLIVNQGGKNAQYKGVGTLVIGGVAQSGRYGFMLWAQDGTPDLFRIEITNLDSDTVIYDNKIGSEFGTAIGGGSIIVHTPKR